AVEQHSGIGLQGSAEIFELRGVEPRVEVADAIEEIRRAEILPRTAGMDVARRLETILLEEHEPDAPAPLLDRLAAVAAASAPGRGAIDRVEARQAAMLHPELRRRHERTGDLELGSTDVAGFIAVHELEERLGTLVGGARQVKPQCHLAFAERVRLALAEAQLVLRDPAAAAAALRAAGSGRLDYVRHDTTSVSEARL